MAQQLLVDQGHLTIEASRSHPLETPHSVEAPLAEWSARRRDIYLTTHSTHKKQTGLSIPPAGLEPTIPASERPQTHALDGAATGKTITKLYFQQCKTHTRTHIYIGLSFYDAKEDGISVKPGKVGHSYKHICSVIIWNYVRMTINAFTATLKAV